jgi:SAM-dependent methyltransferase
VEQRYYAEYRDVEDRHWWFTGRRTILLRVLDEQLSYGSGPPSRRILDLGCGTGAMLEALTRYGSVQGADADAEAIRFCKARGIERVQRLESDVLPWADGSFDVVAALDVLEHIGNDRAMFDEVARVLRPGGTFVLTVPAYQALWGPQDEISHHERRYRAGQVRERIGGAGLRLKKLSYFNTLLFPPIATVRLLRRWGRRGVELKSDFTMSRPGRVNDLLAGIFSSEAAVVARWNLPFGVSILGIAVKDLSRP